MNDLTDAQFAVYVDRILECRKAEDTAKEDTKQAYADLKDAGGDKTEAGLLVRALRMEEKDAGKAKAREEMLEEARQRYRRGKASHVRAREASQSYAEAKGREPATHNASVSKASSAETAGTPAGSFDLETGELTDTQEQSETDLGGSAPQSVQPRAVDSEYAGTSSDENPAPLSPAPHLSAVPDGEPGIPSSDAGEGKNVEVRASAERAAKADIVHAQSEQAVTFSEAEIPAFIKNEQRKSIADYRPNCLHPDACAANGLTHCYVCRKAMEAASETEAA